MENSELSRMDRIKEASKPTLANLQRDVRNNPGWYIVPLKLWRRNAEARKWDRIIWTAVFNGDLKMGWDLHLYPKGYAGRMGAAIKLPLVRSLFLLRYLIAKFAPGMILAYVLTGVLCGTSLASVMPAVNWKGATYVAATWPAWIDGSPIPALPIPAWAFTTFQPA